MIFSSLSKREKRIFYASGIILGCAVFYTFFLHPLIKAWSGMDGAIAAKKVKLHKSIRFLTQCASRRDEYKKYADILKKQDKTDEQVMAALLSEADRLAVSCGLYVTVLKPNAITPGDFYQRFVVEIEADAPASGLISFLYQIEQSPKLLSVDSLQVNAKAQQPDLLKSRIFISRVLFVD